MGAKRVTWVAVLVGAVGAIGIIGCRKGPAASKGDVSASAKASSTGGGNANNAKMWVPPLAGLAVDAAGTPWATGRIYSPFDFGSGMVSSSGGADLYLAKLDPTTCQATETFVFGGAGDNDQTANGVAVSSRGNVALIGSFTGEIAFTANRADGSGPSGKPGSAGLDFLQSGPPVPFYGVFNGHSKGGHIVPVKAHMVDVGSGALLSVGSNPGQNSFAICGKTDKAVANWSESAVTKGVITGGKAVAGGGMDIVVAKIDAATGSVIWGRQFGGVGEQVCDSVTVDNNGDVIIAGGYSGTLSFDKVALPKVADLTLAIIYVAKLEGSTGTAISAQTWRSAGRSNAYGLTVDSDSNIVLAGLLGADMDLGGGLRIANYGWTDAFVIKLTPALAPVWAKSFGDDDLDQGVKSVGVSSKGNVIIGGTFQGSLGTLGLVSAGKTAASDGFTAELAAADGAILSARAYGDAAGAQSVSVVTVARAASGALTNSIFVGGTFFSSITFGSTTLSNGSPRSFASYVARLAP